jgi:hypothetical protein
MHQFIIDGLNIYLLNYFIKYIKHITIKYKKHIFNKIYKIYKNILKIRKICKFYYLINYLFSSSLVPLIPPIKSIRSSFLKSVISNIGYNTKSVRI